MAVGIELVGDLGFLLLVCSGIGALAYIFKQPMILGFLVAGILIGPFGPLKLVQNTEMLNNFSDIAIVLLLFGVGLSFPLRQLRAIGKLGTGIAVIEVLAMLGIGFAVGAGFGWSFYDSMFLAAALSISSTAIIVKVLEDMGKMEATSSILMIGVLVIEDLVAVVMISAMHAGVVSGSFDFMQILVTIGQIGLFIGGTIAAGVILMPKIFALIARLERYEITVMFALGTAFGLAFLSHELGFSAATGAFLAGVIIAGTRFSEQVSNLITPTREIFTAIFFVTIGALMDLSTISLFWVPVAIITAVTVLGKMGAVYAGVRVFGFEKTFAIGIGLSMAQLGEFSFIVLKTGQDLGVVSPFLFPIVGMVVALTTFIGPMLVKLGTRAVAVYE
ncbi:Kef-type K+ transport system, predicted NAD-binding component [Candidatus Nitrososphaera evergladensis SR1]|uniref:Kef-type K+ transport system, predicted NAD-binding component n=1 Tax=Candidatus Nitrososphaera evergladensis SR1 TaxID=1459636 RepID=A0A075MQY7_9ARCH|nr:cation:proton antiporter [Candidatus Nitrososphaera evergladensis]AIF83628.1 Kef-type K+ transport system, predicted NAD-binding component [Candidatus Nitrososphaera evergladensis SR1]